MDFGIARSLREKGITGPTVLIGHRSTCLRSRRRRKRLINVGYLLAGIILYEMATGECRLRGHGPQHRHEAQGRNSQEPEAA